MNKRETTREHRPEYLANVGQVERLTQKRLVTFFRKPVEAGGLGYRYLGDWEELENNSNIETDILKSFLRDKQKYSESLITKALYELNKAAGSQSKSLYEVNHDLYNLLRYGIKVAEDAGDHKQTVWLID